MFQGNVKDVLHGAVECDTKSFKGQDGNAFVMLQFENSVPVYVMSGNERIGSLSFGF